MEWSCHKAKMRMTIFVAIFFLGGLVCQVQAQVSSSPASSDLVLVSANGIADNVTLTIPSASPNLESLEGVVNIVLNSDTACATISAPIGWESIISTATIGGNLCSRVFEHAFSAGEGPNTGYAFSWTGPTTYTAKLLSLANASTVDVASGAAGFGTAWVPPQVATNYTGEYLLGFYMNSSNPAWTPPADVGVVQENTTRGYPDLITRAWQQARGATDSFEASCGGGGQWGIGQLVAFRPR